MHRNYDMEKMLVDIQKEYPKAKLTFQNIYIEENFTSVGSTRGNRYDYYKKYTLRVNNNQLQREPNFLWFLMIYPLLIVVAMMLQDIRTLKLKDFWRGDWFG